MIEALFNKEKAMRGIVVNENRILFEENFKF